MARAPESVIQGRGVPRVIRAAYATSPTEITAASGQKILSAYIKNDGAFPLKLWFEDPVANPTKFVDIAPMSFPFVLDRLALDRIWLAGDGGSSDAVVILNEQRSI